MDFFSWVTIWLLLCQMVQQETCRSQNNRARTGRQIQKGINNSYLIKNQDGACLIPGVHNSPPAIKAPGKSSRAVLFHIGIHPASALVRFMGNKMINGFKTIECRVAESPQEGNNEIRRSGIV
ncbi:MAG: hypothetical protein HUN04_10570 [Desulfobacter sp.]|nr:MAG: hypothetical protein HUN04_10570 [Desulfobacter sp.]